MKSIQGLHQISTEVNELMRIKFIVSVFVFTLTFFLILLGVCRQFLKIHHSIASRWCQTLDDKSVQCLQSYGHI